jgi:hypothetical protein
MTPAEILEDCKKQGVKVFLLDGNLSARGLPEAVERVKPMLKQHKADIVRYLAETVAPMDMVREFMEVDGLPLEEAQAMAAISIRPRSSGEWLALITELDAMIERYCLAAGLSPEKLAELLTVRNRQALASIPESLTWFTRAWETLHQQASPKPSEQPRERLMPYSSRDSAKAAQRRLMQGYRGLLEQTTRQRGPHE